MKKNIVSIISIFITALLVLWGTIFPDPMLKTLKTVFSFLTDNFDWSVLISANVFLISCIVIGLSRIGKIKLGADTDKPEYSSFSWFSMMFTSGMGIGLIFWSIAEPLAHYTNPPFGEANTIESAETAMRYTFFHWNIHPWGMFALGGLAMAYFQFKKGLPCLISSTLQPLIGDRHKGRLGKTVDIFAIMATVIGLAISLGLGTLQINSGLTYLFGVADNAVTKVLIIAIISSIYITSAVIGISKGIKYIAGFTIFIALALMAFLIIAGPGALIFKILTPLQQEVPLL